MNYPIELPFPDISRWRAGNSGIDYVWTFASDAPGPHVMVNALTHGNEVCGAIVVDELLAQGVRPRRGTLTLSFANVAAYESFDRAHPTASRCLDEDFNRLWSDEVLDGPRGSRELARARALRPVVARADYLLDIHSMHTRIVPLAMAGPLDKGRALAQAIGFPAHVVMDAGHAAGRRMRDYKHFGDANDPRNALLIECGQHWEAASLPVAREMTMRFLHHFGVIDARLAEPYLGEKVAQKVIRVTDAITVKSEHFRFAREFRGLEALGEGELIGTDGGTPVRAPYADCVLVMPTPNVAPGQTAVRLGRYL